jgi:DNA-binding CsgD family transcriptional regulator
MRPTEVPVRRVTVSSHPMEVVSIIEGTAAFLQQLEEIHATAQHEVLVFDTAPYAEPIEASTAVELQLPSKGVSHRAIYDLTALGIEGRMDEVEERIAAGEQARVIQRLPIKLSIIDRRIAVMPLDASSPTQGTLLVHGAFLLDALVAQFESFWERARPLSPDTPFEKAIGATGSKQLSQRDRRILHLLAAGAKDVAIARQLGTSPVTIRRRIRRLTAALGVETRFQAGVAATKRGWL